MIEKLFEAGADVFRINMSHTSHDAMRELRGGASARSRRSSAGRSASSPTCRGRSCASARSRAAPSMLKNGATLRARRRPTPGDADARPPAASRDPRGARGRPPLLLDDGKVRLQVDRSRAPASAVTDGRGRRQACRTARASTCPTPTIRSSALTEKDRSDLEAALDTGVDWVALSFVQRPEDIAEARKIARGRAAVMAKIEKPQAVARLAEIIELSDALMVARGDLGVEMPLEKVPGHPEADHPRRPPRRQAGGGRDADARNR